MYRKLAILLTLLSAIMFPGLSQAKVYMVAVGLADYPGTVNDLVMSANDARRMASVYQQATDTECVLITNSDATLSTVRRAMDRTFAKAGADDIVVFFFSGHGTKGSFVLYDGFLDYGSVRKSMAKSKSKNKMIFADACFSGNIRTKKSSSRSDASAEKKSRKSNVMLFLSSRGNEKSYEGEGLRNSIFTTCLIEAIGGSADRNRDNIISAKELFNFVSRNVARMSGDTQHPVMWGKFSDSMPVMRL